MEEKLKLLFSESDKQFHDDTSMEGGEFRSHQGV